MSFFACFQPGAFQGPTGTNPALGAFQTVANTAGLTLDIGVGGGGYPGWDWINWQDDVAVERELRSREASEAAAAKRDAMKWRNTREWFDEYEDTKEADREKAYAALDPIAQLGGPPTLAFENARPIASHRSLPRRA